MSLRAIKKRENQLNPRQTIFKKSATTSTQQQRTFNSSSKNATTTTTATPLSSLQRLQQQHTLLGRASHSNPELRHPFDTLERFAAAHARLVRTKSDSDISALLKVYEENVALGLIGAKSEICLQSISSHNYQPQTTSRIAGTTSNNMLSGARSHRDLTQSAYATTTANLASPTRRRMSECSLNSSSAVGGGSGAYSQRTSAMSSSAITLSSSAGGVCVDPNAVVRVPIIGYEVMEERARFTVYKLRVENPLTNDCWLVLRRYTDFVRLNTKLKQACPQLTLMLPRKKIFGDNFNSVFLDNRVQGLQMFVNSIMSKEELRRCKLVREFFCLDEPPTYSESMEECRAIFEAQEETIAHLKMQISSKNDLILSLQQKLRDEVAEKEQHKDPMRNTTQSCARCSTSNGTSPIN